MGGDLPDVKDITIYHSGIFTVDTGDPALIFTVEAFEHYSILHLSFTSAVTGFAVGEYDYVVTLNYGAGQTAQVPVKLTVLSTTDDFYVSPTTVVFDAYRNANIPDPKVINTISPSNWTINQNLPSWLNVSQMQGNMVTDLFLTVLNYNDLPAGAYNFILDLVNETETKSVDITLNVHDFLQHPFKPGNCFLKI